MEHYIVTIRLASGGYDYYDCYAESKDDARQQAGWAYLRLGVVTRVESI